MSRLWMLAGGACLAALALGGNPAAAASADEICPVVTVDPGMKQMVSYPGGEAGRRKGDYTFIAVVLGAEAVCGFDDDDNLIATVTVTYAVEAGPLYRGSADVPVAAIVRNGGAEVIRGGARKTSSPPTGGGALTVTDTISGLLVGEDDEVEDGNFSITAGFEKK